MTWKSYAVVSGATVLAGWLASSPPSVAPVSSSAPAQRTAPVTRTAAESDIEEQAARLQARVRQEVAYRQPERNPFRFGAKQKAARSVGGDISFTPPPAPIELAPITPQAVAISLSGIAEDQVGERMERTAILSAPSDVLLVREGDEVMGQYRVAKIEAGAVELVKLSDGSTLRLALKASNAQ
jgi:hypothetical protein